MTSYFHLFVTTGVSEQIEQQNQLYLFSTSMCFILRVKLMMSIVYNDVIIATHFLKAFCIKNVEITEMNKIWQQFIQFKRKYTRILKIGFS